MPEDRKNKAIKKPVTPARAVKKAAAAPKKSVKQSSPVEAVKKAVARPVTRAVVKRAAVLARPVEPRAPRAPRVAPRPLPTAPAGQVPLIGADGAVAGSLALPGALGVSVDPTVIFQAIVASNANARMGTAATKNRSRVAGGGAKPWRQKGTGRARQGSTRAPQWRHGGVVFGPNGRTYDQRIPRRIRRAALGASLAERAAEGRVLVLEALRLPGDRPRSRDLVDWLAKVGEVNRAILVTGEMDESLSRAAANVRGIEVRTAGQLRLIDVMRADTLLILRDALDALAARASSSDSEAA